MSPPGVAAANLRWALTLIDGLVAAGVGQAVISPGSRSTPLALACEQHPGMRVHVVLDERSAAFFALGLARAENRPAALIATSGSAPANWFPALVEANHGMVPLILLSADRPPELRACGANQTIEQAGMFGTQVRFAFDLGVPEETPAVLRQLTARARQAVAASRWPLPGPVHLNVPLREPLVPGAPVDFAFSAALPAAALPVVQPAAPEVEWLAAAISGKPGLIVCGAAHYPPGFAAAVTALAARLDCPLVADPLANLRFGGHERRRILTHYDTFLRDPRFAETQRPAWVLRFGAMPVSKALQHYLAAPLQDDQDGAHHVVVDPHGRRLDPLHQGTLLHADAEALCAALTAQPLKAAPSGWMAAFAARETSLAASGAPLPIEAEVIRAMLALLPPQSTLFCGNSMPIRDLDSFSGSGEKPLRIVANRGVSGIDGNISTVLGMAAARRGKVVALLGDLACCHDIGGLLAARGLDAVLVVLNNGGGGIFGYLPQAGLESFERLWLTPAGLDFAQAARLYGLGYRRAENPAEFAAAFAQQLETPGVHLLEVVIDREASLAAHRAYWEKADNQSAGESQCQ